jgi:hypothetical protein
VAVDLKTQKAWARTWQAAGEALDKVRRAELRALTPEKALFATDNLLSLGTGMALPERRRGTSGLVEQQRLFARLRP